MSTCFSPLQRLQLPCIAPGSNKQSDSENSLWFFQDQTLKAGPWLMSTAVAMVLNFALLPALLITLGDCGLINRPRDMSRLLGHVLLFYPSIVSEEERKNGQLAAITWRKRKSDTCGCQNWWMHTAWSTEFQMFCKRTSSTYNWGYTHIYFTQKNPQQ